MAKNLKETDAKQGRSGKPILIVLVAAMALVVIGYLIVGFVGTATSPDGSLEQSGSVDAAGETTTGAEGETVTPSESEPLENNGVAVPE